MVDLEGTHQIEQNCVTAIRQSVAPNLQCPCLDRVLSIDHGELHVPEGI